MTQIVLQHYEKPAARRHLWVGLVMAVVALCLRYRTGRGMARRPPDGRQGTGSQFARRRRDRPRRPPSSCSAAVPERLMAPMLGLAGGMMLAASLFAPRPSRADGGRQRHAVGARNRHGSRLAGRCRRHADARPPLAAWSMSGAVESSGLQPECRPRRCRHRHSGNTGRPCRGRCGSSRRRSRHEPRHRHTERCRKAGSSPAPCSPSAPPRCVPPIALGTGLVEPVGGLFGVIASTVAGAACRRPRRRGGRHALGGQPRDDPGLAPAGPHWRRHRRCGLRGDDDPASVF